MGLFRIVVTVLGAFVRNRSELAFENLALRQQLAALQHKSKRPLLRPRDRVFWALLSRIWPSWRSVLLIVRPDTVVRWHRQGFKLFWRWKSRSKVVSFLKTPSAWKRTCRVESWGAYAPLTTASV